MSRETSETIQRIFWERASKTDQEVLEELEAFDPLPDERDDAWSSQSTWERALLFVALADVVAARRLRAAVPVLLERSCFGDPGETMRGLRHSLEAAFKPDWSALARVCELSAESPARGARLWATEELGILGERSSAPVLVARLADAEAEIRAAACTSLGRLCCAHPEVADSVREQVRIASSNHPEDPALRRLVGILGPG